MLVKAVVGLDAVAVGRRAGGGHGVAHGGEHDRVILEQRQREVREAGPGQVLAHRRRPDQPLGRRRAADLDGHGAHAIVVDRGAHVAAHEHQRRPEVERDADGPEPPVAGGNRPVAVEARHVAEGRLDGRTQGGVVVERLPRRAVGLGHHGQAADVIPGRPVAGRCVAVVDVVPTAVAEEVAGGGDAPGLRLQRRERLAHAGGVAVGAGRSGVGEEAGAHVVDGRGVQTRREEPDKKEGEEAPQVI